MKKIVLYSSKTGFTEKYAKWISEELNSDLKDINITSLDDLIKYDTIIYGGGVYAGVINKLSSIRNDFSDKNLIVFAVGMNKDNRELDKLKTSNKVDNLFYMPGGLDNDKMSFTNRMLLKTIKRMIKTKDNRTKEDQEFIDTIGTSIDYTDKKYIKPLIEYIKSNY